MYGFLRINSTVSSSLKFSLCFMIKLPMTILGLIAFLPMGSIPLTVSLPIIGMGYLLTEPFRISVPKFFRQFPLDGSKVKSLPFPGFLILHYYQIKLLEIGRASCRE